MLYILIAFIVGVGFVLAPMLTPMMFLIAGPVAVVLIVFLVVQYRNRHVPPGPKGTAGTRM
jgi:hypothetical protein